jgi:hypothetical protein
VHLQHCFQCHWCYLIDSCVWTSCVALTMDECGPLSRQIFANRRSHVELVARMPGRNISHETTSNIKCTSVVSFKDDDLIQLWWPSRKYWADQGQSAQPLPVGLPTNGRSTHDNIY